MVATRTPTGGTIVWRGQRIALSPTRYRLVACLARGNGRFIHARELAQLVFGEVTCSAQNNLRVVVCHVNARLPGLIESELGWGYRLATQRVEGL